MKELDPLAYIESSGSATSLPLERYLPPYQYGIVTQWLEDHATKESWILEPIGSNPAAILEAAREGYKILAAINNPVNSFLLTMLARSPSVGEFESVMAELAMQKKGSERLQTHLMNLYQTRCASCGKDIYAESYLWHRSDAVPFARIYTCPFCGDAGEHAVNDEDVERLITLQRSDGLHRARAIERVPGGTREARENLEEIIKIYPTRALYALFTLINKIEGMSLQPQRRALLDALLISALDTGHTIQPDGEVNERPRLLFTPTDYVEQNIWMVMEKSITSWTTGNEPTQITEWPALPESGGICLYNGRMRDFYSLKPQIHPESMFCVVPRPNQAFWTFSILWSSWLWGKENAGSLRNILERQRFDWYWHANALQSAFAPASYVVKENSPSLLILTEPVPGFVSSVFEACAASGITLRGYAYKNESDPIELEYQGKKVDQEVRKSNLHRIIHDAIYNGRTEVGEPCRYQKLHTTALLAIEKDNCFPRTVQQLSYEAVGDIHNEITKVFNDRKFLSRLDATAQEFESGYWWLAQFDGFTQSLSDRIEIETSNILQKEKCLSFDKLKRQLNRRFSGLLTPDDEFLNFCLQSYAVYDSQMNNWSIKQNEQVEKRQIDLSDIQKTVKDLAIKLNLDCREENPLYWYSKDQPNLPRYKICMATSAAFNRFTLSNFQEPVETVFIFPASRSALVRYKLDHNPKLREDVGQQWHFLKYRTLRELAGRKDISLDLWDLFIDSDPVSLEEATQLSMFL